MFSPIGAISSFGTGYQHGMTEDLPKMWNQLGMAALGRALQPIDGMDQGPQAPPPGQASVPLQHPMAQRPMPPEMQGTPMAQQQTPMSGGMMPSGPSFNERFSPVSAAVGSGEFDPRGTNNSPMFSGGPPQPSAMGPPGAAPPGPPGMGGPPGMSPPPQGMPGAMQGGMPQFDLQTLIQRVHAANPGLPPQAMLAALNNAVPLLNVQGKHDLQMLALQQKYDTLETRERIAQWQQQGAGARNTERVEGANQRSAATIEGANTRNTERVEGANTRAELSRNTRLDIANLSAETRREIEDAKTGRAQLSVDAKREIAGMNVDARREIAQLTEAGRNDRFTQGEEGKTTRQGAALASRESEGALNRGSRESIAATNEAGRQSRAEMSNSTKLELGKLSDQTKREIATQAQQGRLDVAQLSAGARQELAGINNQARMELQTYIEGERGARAAAGNVSREGIAGLRAETTAEQGAANRVSREGIAGLNAETRTNEGALNRGSREGIAATNEAGRQGRFTDREGRLDKQFNATYDRLVSNAQQRWDMNEKKLQQAMQLATTREGRLKATGLLRTLEQEALANHRAVMEKIQAGFLPNAKDKNALIAEANAKRDAFMAKLEQYKAQLREGGQAPSEAAPAAPAGPAQAAPAARPTATGPNGQKVEWDGKAWVPVR